MNARPLVSGDWTAAAAILADAIRGGEASFETEPPTWEQFDVARPAGLRFVAVDGLDVLGWAAAGPSSPRAVLRGVLDHQVYVRADSRGRGVGALLLDALVAAAEAGGYWTIQSQVFRENTASLALHERFGFRVVGYRERLARSTFGPHAGQWRDALLIERRSAVNGRD